MNQWISCDEDLPKKYGRYLCTFEDGHVDVDSYEKFKTISRWHSKTFRGRGTTVIAWMPIPEPYNASAAKGEDI